MNRDPSFTRLPAAKRTRFLWGMSIGFAFIFGALLMGYALMYVPQDGRGLYFLMAVLGIPAGGVFAAVMWKVYGEEPSTPRNHARKRV